MIMSEIPDMELLDSLLRVASEAPWRDERACRFRAAFLERTAPLVLCGAGGLGRRTLHGLLRAGHAVAAFADNNPAKWGSFLDGVSVLSPEEAARSFPDALFVFTIWGAHAPACSPEMIAGWEQRLGRPVSPFQWLHVLFPTEFLPYYAFDLPARMAADGARVRAAFALMGDAPSRSEYLRQVRWRAGEWLAPLPMLEGVTPYFDPSLVRLRPGERVADLGAYDGDTLADFLRVMPYQDFEYEAWEPDPGNFAALADRVASLPEAVRPRIRLLRAGAGAREGTTRFNAEGSLGSCVAASGGIEVRIACLDDAFRDRQLSFLKMDIEGAEPEALEGARAVLLRDRPIVCFSAYHLQAHLWELPLQLAGLLVDYRYFLRPHDRNGFDVVLYCIPVERLP